MTGAIGGVLLGCILAIVAYLKAVRASSFRWRTYHLLMENYQLIHGTYGLRREKVPGRAGGPAKGLSRPSAQAPGAGHPGPPAEAGPGGCPPPAHPAAGRQQGRSGRPLCPRRPVPQIPDLCPGLLPVRVGAVRPLRHLGRAPRCLPAAGGRAPGGVDPHRLEPNPPPGGTVCRPGSSSSALPCSRPPHPPCEALPGLTGGGDFFFRNCHYMVAIHQQKPTK